MEDKEFDYIDDVYSESVVSVWEAKESSSLFGDYDMEDVW